MHGRYVRVDNELGRLVDSRMGRPHHVEMLTLTAMPRISVKPVWGSLLALTVLGIGTEAVQRSSLAGVELSQPARELLERVETAYGQEVVVELMPEWEPSRYGASRVSESGAPEISLNPDTGLTEETIAHELLHLEFKKEGFAIVTILFPAGTATPANRDYIHWAVLQILDPIRHELLFPRMRSMGLNPIHNLELELEEVIATGRLEGLRPATERQGLALRYMKVALALGRDEQLVIDLRDLYDRNGWADSLRLGEEFTSIIESTDFGSPEAQIDLLVRCFNLLGNNARLRFSGWADPSGHPNRPREALLELVP